MKLVHVSFDDVWRVWHDLTAQPFSSAFDHPFLADLKAKHERHGAVFTLYCFNRYTPCPAYDLAQLPACYGREIGAASAWLRLGFHGADERANYGTGLDGASTGGTPAGDCPERAAADYAHFVDAVLGACGTAEVIDRVVRLGFFGGTAKNVRALMNCECGVTGLLAADDGRVSYHLNAGENEILLRQGAYTDGSGLPLIRTQRRLEKVEDGSAYVRELACAPGDALAIFTHEQAYTPAVSRRMDEVLCWAKEAGYSFGFLQNGRENPK